MNPTMDSAMVHRVVISLGSNIEEGESMIAQCVERLGAATENCSALIVFDSPVWVYSTPSVSGKGADYFNCVMSGFTTLGFAELSGMSKEIETEMGRTEECKLIGRVPIDIDIVVFDGDVKRPRDFAQPYFTIGYSHLPEPQQTESAQ